MKKGSIILLILVVLVAILAAGCTSTSPAATPVTGTTVKPTTAPVTTSGNYATVWPTEGTTSGPGDLHGKMMMETDNTKPFKGVIVYIWKYDNSDDKTVKAFAKGVTDANGEYKISNIPNGDYYLRITAPGNLGYHDAGLVTVNGPTVFNDTE